MKSRMELTKLTPSILLHIAQQLSISLKSLVATIELLDEGATVPFVAHYRKEVTSIARGTLSRDLATGNFRS